MSCRVDGTKLESAQYLAHVSYHSRATCSDGCCSESWWEGTLYKLNNGSPGECLSVVGDGESGAMTGPACVKALLTLAQYQGYETTMENTVVTSGDEDYYA